MDHIPRLSRIKGLLFASAPRHFIVLWPSSIYIGWFIVDDFPLRVDVTIRIADNEYRKIVKYCIKSGVVGIFPLTRSRYSTQVQEHSANDHCYKGPNEAIRAISITYTPEIYHYALNAYETAVNKTSHESSSHIPTKIKLSGPNNHIIKFIVRKPEVVVRKLDRWTQEEGILRIV